MIVGLMIGLVVLQTESDHILNQSILRNINQYKDFVIREHSYVCILWL